MISIVLKMMLFIKSHIPVSVFMKTNFVKRVLGVLSLLVLLAVSSCNTNALYEKNIHLESGVWNVENKLKFDVSIDDSIAPYDFYLNIRHNDDYEYSNLFLFIDTYYPTSEYTRDTIEILLSDIQGKWFGEGFGKLKEIRVLLKKGVSFPSSGDYTFDFVQAMRTEDLNGIEDFGIRIEKMR